MPMRGEPEPTRERGRIRWLCRRGMKELDVLLERFFAAEFDRLEAHERAAFVGLLEQDDPQLHTWLAGRETPADPGLADMARRIREYRAQV